METIAGPVFRFSTRRPAAFSHGFDVARIGTGSPHRPDQRFIKHSDIRVRGFFWTGERARLPRFAHRDCPREPRIEILVRIEPESRLGFCRREKQYVLIYYRSCLPFHKT